MHSWKMTVPALPDSFGGGIPELGLILKKNMSCSWEWSNSHWLEMHRVVSITSLKDELGKTIESLNIFFYKIGEIPTLSFTKLL